MIRLVIAEDHTIVREGLKQLLVAEDDLRVIGEARTGAEVLQRVREDAFDVLLLDMSMPGKSGIELIKQIHGEKPKLRILVLTMHEEREYIMNALKTGAEGYLLKSIEGPELEKAILVVFHGGKYFSAFITDNHRKHGRDRC